MHYAAPRSIQRSGSQDYLSGQKNRGSTASSFVAVVESWLLNYYQLPHAYPNPAAAVFPNIAMKRPRAKRQR